MILFPLCLASIRADGRDTIGYPRYIASVPAGGILGFGLGHSVQGRWADDGWKYSLIDLAGVLACIGECNLGGAILISSRIAQVLETSVYSPEVKGWAGLTNPSRTAFGHREVMVELDLLHF